MKKRALKGISRVFAKQSAQEAAMLTDSKMAYLRGELGQVKSAIGDATGRFTARARMRPDGRFKRTDREELLRELRRKPGARPGARIPEQPAFVTNIQRTTDAVLKRQVRDSAVMVRGHIEAQARAMGLDASIDRRALLARTKRIMDKRIERFSRRAASDMWRDIRRQTWRSVGKPVGSIDEILSKRVKVYESKLRRIIVTESQRAYNVQMLEVMDQVAAQNRDKRILKRWDATIDKRLCLDCREMHGAVSKLHAKFSRWDLQAPPLHPYCRCVLTIW
ncbi:MAG TPA: phage minor head protein, partial [Thermoleophilia bacterium]|nr:phage minor head protein [Thermoleophilia bacterium]